MDLQKLERFRWFIIGLFAALILDLIVVLTLLFYLKNYTIP